MSDLTRLLQRRTAAERHERRLLKMRTLTRDSTMFNMQFVPRFAKREDGSVAQYDSFVISKALWERRVAELRHPAYPHNFRGGTQPIFVSDTAEGSSWPLRAVVCVRCGEARHVSWMLDPTQIRDYWCTG